MLANTETYLTTKGNFSTINSTYSNGTTDDANDDFLNGTSTETSAAAATTMTTMGSRDIYYKPNLAIIILM